MKNSVFAILLFFFSMSLFMSCQNTTADVVDVEQIKQEIQEKENEWAALYNSGELKEIGYYAEDAISFSQNNAPLIGKEAIKEYIVASVDSSFGSTISFETIEVFVSNDGNQVVETGYYKLIDSDSIPLNTGYFMTLFEKIDGKYVSVRDMSTSDMPREF